MNFEIKPSFECIYKKLPRSEKIQIDNKIKDLFAYYNKGVVFAGLRVRKISGKDNYFEIDTSPRGQNQRK